MKTESSKQGVSPSPPHPVAGSSALRKGAPAERTIDIYINGTLLVSVQASPHDLNELALGFLLNESIITGVHKITDININDLKVDIHTDPPPATDDLRFRLNAGCGRGITFTGKLTLRPVSDDLKIKLERLFPLMQTFAASTPLYGATGGMHAAGLASAENVLAVKEDLGRHNAVDRIRGWMFYQAELPKERLLLTSGRVSTDMVSKAAGMGIALIAGRTAATDRAIALAEELGIEVIGYMRGERYVLYTSVGKLLI